MLDEPIAREDGDLFKGSWFFEEMGCVVYDAELAYTSKTPLGLAIEFEHGGVTTTHDQQRRYAHA